MASQIAHEDEYQSGKALNAWRHARLGFCSQLEALIDSGTSGSGACFGVE
jgi:hypothetical protein